MTTERAATRVDSGALGPMVARRFIRATLAGWNRDQITSDAELLVSEVVTIASQHDAGVAADVTVSFDGDVVRIEVSDPHRGFADDPSAHTDDAEAHEPPDGLGLRIVDWVAPRWGVDLTEPGKTVWFELEPASA